MRTTRIFLLTESLHTYCTAMYIHIYDFFNFSYKLSNKTPLKTGEWFSMNDFKAIVKENLLFISHKTGIKKRKPNFAFYILT